MVYVNKLKKKKTGSNELLFVTFRLQQFYRRCCVIIYRFDSKVFPLGMFHSNELLFFSQVFNSKHSSEYKMTHRYGQKPNSGTRNSKISATYETETRMIWKI